MHSLVCVKVYLEYFVDVTPDDILSQHCVSVCLNGWMFQVLQNIVESLWMIGATVYISLFTICMFALVCIVQPCSQPFFPPDTAYSL